jgi:hypothetical protein
VSSRKDRGLSCRDEVDPPFPQLDVADFLHHQIAREPARRLEHDRPHAIAFDPLKHGREARVSIGSAPLTAAS